MNIGADRLKQIIVEEYLREEGIIDEALSKEKSDQVLAWLRGEGPRPDWLTDDYGTAAAAKRRKNQAVQAPVDDIDRAADTMPLPPRLTQDEEDEDEPEIAEPDDPNPIKTTIDGITDLVSGMDPEDVKDIFQIVFQNLPGVELLSPGDEGYPEDKPPTEYVRGAMGRPKISTFGLDELKQLIVKVLTEGHYHDMGDEHELYNALDPYNFEKMSDEDLVDIAEKDGIPYKQLRSYMDDVQGISLTPKGRKELIAVLQNV